MKKLLLVVVLVVSALMAQAQTKALHELSNANGIFDVKWSPIQLALVPEKYCHLFSGTADIYGIAIGIFVLEQKSASVSVSVTCGQYYNYGLQVSTVSIDVINYGLCISPIYCFAERNYGMQIGLVNMEDNGKPRREEFKSGCCGFQIGLVNIGQGFQIGLINYNADAKCTILPIINFAK